MTSILIVGSDRYVVDLAVSRGYDVTVVRNTAATQTGLLVFPDCVKEIAVPDQTNLEEILTVIARAGLDVSGFDGVHTNFEFSVAAVATLAAALGKPGIAPHKVAYMRDKFLQKSRLEEAGIRVARTRLATSMADVLDTELGFPVVVKPAAGAGTVDTQRVSEASELSDFARNFFGGGATTGLLIEEFISGDEFCLDGWIVEGRVEFGSVGRYAQTCLSVVESGAEMRMYRCSETTYPGLREAAIELAKESLNTLGYTHGVFHLEFFRQNDGSLVFSECAARRGGASIEEEVRLASATSLAEASLDIALGLRPAPVAERTRQIEVGTVHPKLSAGVVIDLPRVEELLEYPGVEYSRIFSYLGATAKGTTKSTSDRDAVFLVQAPTVDELDMRLDEARQRFLDSAVVVPTNTGKAARAFQLSRLGRDDLIDAPFTL